MPTTSQYQHVFRINKADSNSGDSGSQIPTNRPRRNRQPLSCEACRARKLKCDRQTPCLPCSKRGNIAATSCSYSKKDHDGALTPANSIRSEAQLRLQKLEDMITGLMQTNSSIITSNSMPSVDSQSSSDISESISNGHLDTDGPERHYHGATHWTTILEDIQDIRGLVDERPSSPLPDVPDVAFTTGQSLTIGDFLEALPPRAATDCLVSSYLTSDGIRAPHIHSLKFSREYRAFWNDPSSASLLWLSMLFSILFTSSFLGPKKNEPALGGDKSTSFFTKAAQALVSGGYQKARPYAADAALCYALCSFYVSKREGDNDCWLVMGITTRLAVKMGYHRDPKNLSNISPFEGEMRRRCFFLLDSFDVLLSNEYGLPAILQEEDCDTETPRNLRDEDFDEDCKVLPPSRPSTDTTPILYFCYKSRFAKAHKRAIRHALALDDTSRSYDITLKLDAELHANDEDVPPSLQMASLDDLLLDQPWQTLRRMHIKFQYLRSLCVLHRKYLKYGRTDPKFAYSRKTCIDASLKLLRHQHEIYIETLSGGRYYENTAMLYMLTQHSFLLAAMIICLDMYECHNQQLILSQDDFFAQATKHDALRVSHSVSQSRSHSSRDAQRASTIVANMLSRVPRPSLLSHQAEPQVSNESKIEPNSSTTSRILEANNDTQFWNQQLSIDGTDPFNLIFDGTENIDWDMFDQYLVDGNGIPNDSLEWQIQDIPGPGDMAWAASSNTKD